MFLGRQPKAPTGADNSKSSPKTKRTRRWSDTANRGDTNGNNASAEDSHSELSAAVAAQRDLLRQVGEFMVRYQLTVTGANLSLVCDGLSGRNVELREALAKQELSSSAIDEAWLSQFRRNKQAGTDPADQMEEMMDLMQNAMSDFHTTTQNAREATGAYRSAMDKQLHASELDKNNTGSDPETLKANGKGQEEFSKLLDLSRVMLGQLKTIEAEMERNQREAEGLRSSLAKARKEADADHLTGLPNRRAFERNLASEIERKKETGEPLSVAFCDIDHFKQVNDIHGHEAGDRVLQTFAKSLAEIASDSCFVARHGGEEFVLLFSGLDQLQAFEKLEAARIKLARRRLMNRETGKPFGQITFSAGIAEVVISGDPREALALADAALYQAKETGRNRIVCAD